MKDVRREVAADVDAHFRCGGPGARDRVPLHELNARRGVVLGPGNARRYAESEVIARGKRGLKGNIHAERRDRIYSVRPANLHCDRPDVLERSS